MFEKDDKRYLYWLIDQYLLCKIDAQLFCDEYYYCYDLAINNDSLTSSETEVFAKLSAVAARFSPFEEDLKKYPDTYFSEQQLRDKVLATKKLLSSAQ